MSIHASLTELEHWLKTQGISPQELPPPIEKARLDQLEAALSRPLPPEWLEVYSRHDGLPQWLIFGGDWHLLSSDLVLEVYWENREVFHALVTTEPWRTEWLPLLSNGAGDYLLLDVNTLEVGCYFHGGGEYEAAFPNLTAYFAYLLQDFRTGRYGWSEDGMEYK